MPFAFFLKGILMGLIVSVPLGPVGVMCIQRTINRGLKSGIISGLGATAADTVYAVIASFGLGYIVNFIEKQIYWIQIIGASILIIIAIKIFYTNPAVEFRNNKNKKSSPAEEFLSVFFITLSNPTVFFVFIGLLASLKLVTGSSNVFSATVVISGIFSGAFLWWYSLSHLVNKFRNKIGIKKIWWLNKIMAVIIFICGIVAILDVFIK